MDFARLLNAGGPFFYLFGRQERPVKKGVNSMRLIRSTVVVVLAVTWLLLLTGRDVVISVTDEARSILGKDGEPISVFTFLMLMASSVFLIGTAGVMMALFRNY